MFVICTLKIIRLLCRINVVSRRSFVLFRSFSGYETNSTIVSRRKPPERFDNFHKTTFHVLSKYMYSTQKNTINLRVCKTCEYKQQAFRETRINEFRGGNVSIRLAFAFNFATREIIFVHLRERLRLKHSRHLFSSLHFKMSL